MLININDWTTIEVFETHIIIANDSIITYILINSIYVLKREEHSLGFKLTMNNDTRCFNKKEDRDKIFEEINTAKRKNIINE